MRTLPRTPVITLLATALCLALVYPQTVLADSKKWRANNHTRESVVVVWTAKGCGGSTDRCDGRSFVCHSTKIAPGTHAVYHFQDGSSDRKKLVCIKQGNGWSKTDDTGKRKKNGIKLNAQGDPVWYYE
jgi:hypothetical protein